MKTFINVAQMKLASLTAGQFVETGGYYVKGDAGQAKYLIVAAQAADGYGDHTLANGTVAVLQANSDIINVLQFGAKGDGINNEGSEIIAALTFAENNDKIKEVFIAGGTYIISVAITIPLGVIVSGSSRTNTIIKQINTTVHGFILNSFSVLKNLTIQAPETNINQTTRGVSYSDTTQVQIINVRVLYFGYGLFNGQEGGNLNWINRIVNVRIDNPTKAGVWNDSLNVHDDVYFESVYVRNDSILGALIKTAYHIEGSLNTRFVNCLQDGGGSVGRYNIPFNIVNSRVSLNGRIENAGAKTNGIAGNIYDGLVRCIGSTVAIDILQIHNCDPDPSDVSRAAWVYVDSQSQVSINGLVGNTPSINNFNSQHVGMSNSSGNTLCDINGSSRDLVLTTAGTGSGEAQYTRKGIIQAVTVTGASTSVDVNLIDTIIGRGTTGDLSGFSGQHSDGQEISLIWRQAGVTMTHSGTFRLQGGVDFIASVNSVHKFHWFNEGGFWAEMSRA